MFVALSCPICKKDVLEGSKFHPFCSDRCRVMDLANWATDKYKISTPMQPEDWDDVRRDSGEGADE